MSKTTVVLPCAPGTRIVVQTEFGPKEDLVLGFVIKPTGAFAKIRGSGLLPLDKFDETVHIIDESEE